MEHRFNLGDRVHTKGGWYGKIVQRGTVGRDGEERDPIYVVTPDYAFHCEKILMSEAELSPVPPELSCISATEARMRVSPLAFSREFLSMPRAEEKFRDVELRVESSEEPVNTMGPFPERTFSVGDAVIFSFKGNYIEGIIVEVDRGLAGELVFNIANASADKFMHVPPCFIYPRSSFGEFLPSTRFEPFPFQKGVRVMVRRGSGGGAGGRHGVVTGTMVRDGHLWVRILEDRHYINFAVAVEGVEVLTPKTDPEYLAYALKELGACEEALEWARGNRGCGRTPIEGFRAVANKPEWKSWIIKELFLTPAGQLVSDALRSLENAGLKFDDVLGVLLMRVPYEGMTGPT